MFDAFSRISVCVRMLQFGLQVFAGYWAVHIDGTSCKADNIDIISYISYAIIAFNLILLIMLHNGNSIRDTVLYVILIIDFLAAAVIFILAFTGYQEGNKCAANKVLFTLFSVVSAVAVAISTFLLFGPLGWSHRYANWPGNLAWTFIFLIDQFSGDYATAIKIIGVTMTIICATSFLFNALYSLSSNDTFLKILRIQWYLAIICMCFLEVYAIINLVQSSGGNEQARKSLVVFAAVNAVDLFFWIWAQQRIGPLSGFPDF